MKKKGMMGHIAATAVVLTLISTSLLSGTLAKYTTSVTVNDTAKVAKFAFTMADKGTGGTLSQNQSSTTAATFKIFETNDSAVADGTADQKLIAPGTNGTFNFEFRNTSDVAVDDTYKITLSGDGSGTGQIPLVIKFNNKYFSNFFKPGDTTVVVRVGNADSKNGGDEATKVTVTGPITGDWNTANTLAEEVSKFKTGYKQKVAATEQAFTYPFEWCWAFEGANKGDAVATAQKQSDKLDTALGIAGSLTPKLEIVLTATQLDNFIPSTSTVPTT